MPAANIALIKTAKRLEILRGLQLLDTPAEPAFDRLTHLASMIIHAPIALVSLVEEEREFFKSAVGLSDPWATNRQIPLSHSFCQHVVATRSPLIIADAREDPLVFDNLAITDMGILSFAAIPLYASDEVIGTLCVIDQEPRMWTVQEIELLSHLSELLTTEIKLRNQLLERKKIEDDLLVMLRDAEELNRVKERFVSMASHEFRIPLAIIQSSSDLIKLYGSKITDEKRTEKIENIDTQLLALRTMLQEMLTVSETNKVSVAFHPVPMNVSEFCRGIVEALQVTTQHDLQFSESGTLTEGFVDARLLHHVLTNLLSNAIKYSPQGGSVTCNLHIDEKGLILKVKDSGIGISKPEQAHIFDDFFRAANVGTIQGTGLGLVIVKQIVSLHGGTVTCESELRVGTTFTVWLPAYSLN